MYTNGIRTHRQPKAEEALKAAIVTSRKSKGAPVREQRAGRIDRRRLHRVAVADNRVFTARSAPKPAKVRVTILVDASSSMHSFPYNPEWDSSMGYRDRYDTRAGSLCQIAAQTCQNLAGATDRLEWVTARADAFTTGHGVLMFPLWQTGEDTEQIGKRYNRIRMGGTEEGYALAMAADDMRDAIEKGEQGLVIIISDGAPGEPGHVKWVVEQMERDNIPVVSVALTESAQQPLMYGKANVIKFSSNPKKLAKDMAKVIGRVI